MHIRVTILIILKCTMHLFLLYSQCLQPFPVYNFRAFTSPQKETCISQPFCFPWAATNLLYLCEFACSGQFVYMESHSARPFEFGFFSP